MEFSGVSNEHSGPSIRRARPDEFAQLRKVEFKAHKPFEAVGLGPFVNHEAEDHSGQAALLLVAGDPPEGFVCVELMDGSRT